MLRTSLAALGLATVATLALAQPAEPPKSGKYHVYIGTYTGKDGSKGIYRSELDLATGKLSEPEVAAEVGSPSFLAISPSGKNLYAVGEAAGGKDGGGVYSFALDPATGKLTKLNQNTSGGAGPCHIATDPSGKTAIVANYGGGSVSAFKLKEDGSIEARTAFVQHTGSSIHRGKPTVPHGHCGSFDATGKYALFCDLGLDQVLVYAVDHDKGSLTLATTIKLPQGAGPRHIHIAPSNDLAFVCGELDCTANVIKLDFAGGKHEVLQSISTLPSGMAGKGDSTAEIRIHPNGKYVYVSNRGHNSIAAFGWDGKKLTALGHASAGIKTPRNFNIDPTGQWMLVANQDGGDVIVFKIDDKGMPQPTGNKIAVSKAVCVKFLAKP